MARNCHFRRRRYVSIYLWFKWFWFLYLWCGHRDRMGAATRGRIGAATPHQQAVLIRGPVALLGNAGADCQPPRFHQLGDRPVEGVHADGQIGGKTLPRGCRAAGVALGVVP